jgi:hypothetical protein
VNEFAYVESSVGLFSAGDTLTNDTDSVVITQASYGNRIKFFSKKVGSQGNGTTVTINRATIVSSDPLSLSLSGENVVIGLRYGSSDPVDNTTAQELYDAIMVPGSPGYDEAISNLIGAELPSGGFNAVQIAFVPLSATVTLVDGTDSSVADPIFYASTAGVYKFTLEVSDGELWSQTANTYINCLESSAAIGYVPDSEFLWSYLPDFWKRVGDRNKITSIWNGLIQVVGAEMLRLWGIDYNKSLRDIPELATHRWYGFTTRQVPEKFFIKNSSGDSVATLGVVRRAEWAGIGRILGYLVF